MIASKLLKGFVAFSLIAGVAMPAHAGFGDPRLSKKKIKKIAKKAKEFPLGSPDNPVRAEMPEGQRAYLNRLRCADGNVPKYRRSGNVGPGIYETIVDNYIVDCGSAAPGVVNVQIDMYHPGYVEKEAVKGFTIISP